MKIWIGSVLCTIVAIVGLLIDNPQLSFIISIVLCGILAWTVRRIRMEATGFGIVSLIVALSLLATVGPYMLQPTFGTYTFVTVWSFVIAALAAVLVYKDKKLKKYASGVVLLGVFISVVFWFNGQVMLLDVALDTSDTTHYHGIISDKVYSSKIIPSYSVYIDFESTPKSEPLTGAVEVNEKQYNEYDKGDKVSVKVRDGFLGIRYFEVEKRAIEYVENNPKR